MKSKSADNTDYLIPAREKARAEINQALNGLTTNLIARYPQAETASWPVQKAEAGAFIAAGKSATLQQAPLLAKICLYQHGSSDEPSTLIQVRELALSVIEKNDAYMEALAFIIGARLRRFRELAALQTVDDIAKMTHELREEVEEIRGALAL